LLPTSASNDELRGIRSNRSNSIAKPAAHPYKA